MCCDDEIMRSLSAFLLFLLICFLFHHPKYWLFSSFIYWYFVSFSITRGIKYLQTQKVYLLVTSGSLVGFLFVCLFFFLPSLSWSHTFDLRLCCPFGPGSDIYYLACRFLAWDAHPSLSFLLMFFLFRLPNIQPVNINNKISILFTVSFSYLHSYGAIDYFEYPFII